jgi:cob(I)alamin adenosyltransferase
VEAYGCVDELNASLATVLEPVRSSQDMSVDELVTIQNDLFCLGAHLANPGADTLPPLPQERIESFENAIDRMTGAMPPLGGFILPGGCEASARAHVARTVCRRAERRVAALCRDDDATDGDRLVLRYLNRLADYLFTLARYSNAMAGLPDVHWTP